MENYYGGYNPYPYIYIQYSHDDAQRVIPIIKALKSRNYNVVFDKNFGEEDRYRYLNVQQITQAAAFLLFYSRSAAKSRLIKECVRFAVPMYNLEKICVCLDDTKFGFSFSDLKKNYIILEETTTDEIIDALRPLIEVYLLPNMPAYSYGRSSVHGELRESDDADELQEISDSGTFDEPEEITETSEAPQIITEEHPDEEAPREAAATEPEARETEEEPPVIPAPSEASPRADVRPEFRLPPSPVPSETANRPAQKNTLPEVNELSPDAPEAFPDFEMSDDYDEEDGGNGGESHVERGLVELYEAVALLVHQDSDRSCHR